MTFIVSLRSIQIRSVCHFDRREKIFLRSFVVARDAVRRPSRWRPLRPRSGHALGFLRQRIRTCFARDTALTVPKKLPAERNKGPLLPWSHPAPFSLKRRFCLLIRGLLYP